MKEDSSALNSISSIKTGRLGALLNLYYKIGENENDNKLSKNDSNKNCTSAEVETGRKNMIENVNIANSVLSYGEKESKSEEDGRGKYGTNAYIKTSFDAADFDVHTYFRNLLQSVSLKDLLKHNNELIDEIKELNAEMQMLVYENYSKFISSTDTIKAIKESVESMEEDTTKLTTTMDVISKCTYDFYERMQDKYEKIDELLKITQLLLQLKKLYIIPEKMKRLLDNKRYVEAIKLYLCIHTFLEKHSDIPKFNHILTIITKIYKVAVLNLKKRLNPLRKKYSKLSKLEAERCRICLRKKAKMKENSLQKEYDKKKKNNEKEEKNVDNENICVQSADEVISTIDILIKCSFPPHELLNLYLENRKSVLQDLLFSVCCKKCLLIKLKKEENDMFQNAENISDEKKQDEDKMKMRLDEESVKNEDNFKKKNKIEKKSKSNDYNREKLFVLACKRLCTVFIINLIDGLDGVYKCFHKYEKEVTYFDKLIKDFLKSILEDVFNACMSILKRCNTCIDFKKIMVGIDALRCSLRKIHAFLPNELLTIFLKFVSDTSKHIIEVSFKNSYKKIVESLSSLYTVCTQTPCVDKVFESINECEQSIMYYFCCLMTESEPLISELLKIDNCSTSYLIDRMVTLSLYFFQVFIICCEKFCNGVSLAYISELDFDDKSEDMERIRIYIRQLIKKKVKWKFNSIFSLSLVRISRHFECKVIQKFLSVATNLYPSFPENKLVASSSSVSYNNNNYHKHEKSLNLRMRSTGRMLLSSYVFNNAKDLSQTLRMSLEIPNLLKATEPRDVRGVIENVLQEIYKIDLHLNKFLDDPPKTQMNEHHNRRLLTIFCGRKTRMELEMQRTLALKTPIYTNIQFSRVATIMAILKITIRNFIEYAREENFNKFSVQQLQIDTYFLSEILRDFISHADCMTIDGLLDEVVYSACARCIDYNCSASSCNEYDSVKSDSNILLDKATVVSICDNKRARFNFNFQLNEETSEDRKELLTKYT